LKLKAAKVMANYMYEMGRGVRSCTEPMGVPAGNWKLEPARFSETAEQIYGPARCKNVEDCHWSNTRRENLKPSIVIRDTETLYFLSLKSTVLIISLMWQRKHFTTDFGKYGGDEIYDRVFVGKPEGKKFL
jgi:hypothetical protein